MELKDIKGIGDKTVEKLNKLDIFTPKDLLLFTPNKYIDMTPIPIGEVRDGFFCTIKAKYTKKLKQFKNKKLDIFSIQAMDQDGDLIQIDWFNQDYIGKVLQLEKDYIFYGRVNVKNNRKILINPEFELDNNPTKLTGIRVEYKTKGLLTNNKISKFVFDIKDSIYIDSFINEEIANKHKIKTLHDAIVSLHFPNDINALSKNLDRIRLEKIINLMVAYNLVHKGNNSKRSFVYKNDLNIIDNAINSLPFKLTESQQNALNILFEQLKSEFNCSIMLLGDVGSGKTIVALLISLYVILCGGKALILVPSETLLNQHFDTATFLKKFGVRVAALSSSTKNKDRLDIINKLNNNEIDLIIGTQSLINEKINLSEFTFAVIDEQQKFGVNDKGNVLKKLKNVDTLIMSATPIPRAINLMFNNSIKVVEIEKPEYKKTNCVTKLVPQKKLYKMLDYLYENKENQKTFVVCPNIFSSNDRLGVYDIFDYYKQKYNYEPLVINSKLSEDDKNQAINDFITSKNNILISTTIIEVGIDIQDATNMVVINSECFGLSSLHQLRGRVGRDGNKAYCYLHYSKETEKIIERLNIIKDTTDGFKISKLDYSMRGGGELFGLKQSGKGDLIDLDIIDSDLIVQAQEIFNDIKDADISKLDQNLLDNISKIVLA